MATLNIVNRSQWRARHGRGGTNVTPSRGGTAVHYNGGPISRGDHANCAARVRSIESFHVSGNGWAGIAYNYLICHHGVVFEGRGWGRRSAAQGTNAGNQNFLAFMFLMGGSQTLNAAMRTAGRLLVLHLRSRGAGSQVRPHSYFTSTSCPGNSGRSWISAGIPGGGVALPDPGNGGGGSRSMSSIQQAVNGLGYTPALAVDGLDGPKTQAGVRWLQSRVGASVDGVWGPETERLYTAHMEDDVPERNMYTTTAAYNQTVPPGEWTTVNFDRRWKDSEGWETKKPEPSFVFGPAFYAASAFVRVDGLEKGQEFQMRLSYYRQDDSGRYERYASMPINSPVHDGGQGHFTYTWTSHVSGSKKGRVRLEVMHYGESDVTITSARADALYWKG